VVVLIVSTSVSAVAVRKKLNLLRPKLLRVSSWKKERCIFRAAAFFLPENNANPAPPA
jgi:hypothetical protein